MSTAIPPAPIPQPRSRRRIFQLSIAVLFLAGLGYLGWRWLLPERPQPQPPQLQGDMTAAMQANLRGVGHMEQFEYVEAVKDFEEAGRAAPDWIPAKINLGIALLNTSTKENLQRARSLFREVLAKEPDHRHADYCLGMIDLYESRPADAYLHYEAVSRLDPNDAHTWFHLGLTNPKGRDSAEAKECFARALKLNPYLNAARYALAFSPDLGDDRKRQLLEEHRALREAEWEEEYRIAYAEMGRYADVIGRATGRQTPEIGPLPMFEKWDGLQIRLAPGTVWAKSADFGAGEAADLQRAIRERFGATIVLLDFNRDGRPDVLLLGSVVRDKRVGDLLLRNDGNGLFTDVTAEAGLSGGAVSFGCAVADYDNDGFPDLLFTGIGSPRLFRNLGNGRFEDVSKAAGLQELVGVYLGSAWVDIDQDGDLDLFLSRFAETPPAALAQLREPGNSGGGLVVMLNVGEAPAAPPGGKQPGLTTKFQSFPLPNALKIAGSITGIAIGDLDGDRDVDLLVLADGKPPTGIWNDRLLRFRSAGPIGVSGWSNGVLLLDANHDERSDLFLLSVDRPPTLWLSHRANAPETLAQAFVPGSSNSPILLQAQAVDLDLDSWTDVVGLSKDRKPVFLQNDGTGKLVFRAEAFGPDSSMPANLQGVASADLDGDCYPDLLLFSENNGLEVRRHLGNGNRAVRLDLSGRRDKGASLRTNADAVGSWVVAQAGSIWSGMELGTLNAGLGQSSLPVQLGLGKQSQAEVVRIRWPDGVPQAELNIATCQNVRIAELNRKGTSCPILFVWDGQRYRYVTDFLGAGAMGESGPDGSTRPPRPEESVKIEPGLLVPRDGWLRIKIAEPMDEVLYLDGLQLLAVDHPAEWSVYPDERFVVNGPPPTQELLFLEKKRPAKLARDHRGNDVTERLLHADRRFVDSFHLRSWLGYAEEHWLELDFGALEVAPKDRLILGLNGWTEYPYPESIYAAEQAKVAMLPPTLELPTAEGTWKMWGELGFPAGLPRTMTRDATGLIPTGGGKFRIRTNMQIYWDQLFIARLLEEKETRDRSVVTTLPVGQATLRNRGFAQEILPDGKPPIAYEDERTEPVAITRWKGRLTKLGDVTELLKDRDDRFVLCGPGDEIEIGFDARRLPALPKGWQRSFVLRTTGYCKDTSPFTATGGTVGPLPNRGMPNYPPTGQPSAAQQKYDREWNTRQIGR